MKNRKRRDKEEVRKGEEREGNKSENDKRRSKGKDGMK